MKTNILVIRLSSLGDIVLTAPVFKNLKAHWPDCRVSVLVKPAYVPVLEGHPCVDEVIAFDGLWSSVKTVRSKGFTHVLDLHANFRSFVLRSLSGAPNAARYRKDSFARRLYVALRWATPALTRHTIDRYLDALEAWGVPARVRGLELGDYRAAAGEAPARRILVVQTAFLGDAMLTVPLLKRLRTLQPGARISVLSRPETADIFHGDADEVVVDDKRGRHAGLRGLKRLAAELRGRQCDLAIIPHRSFRSGLIAWRARIPRRVGFSTSAGRMFMTRTVPFTWGMHDLERNLGLLLPFAAPVPQEAEYLPASQPLAGAVEKRLRSDWSRSAGRPASEAAAFVGVHPGALWPTKRWGTERYAALIRRLHDELGSASVLVGGEGDRALIEEVIALSGAPAVNWAGQTTIPELMALMPSLSLFVTNDSGPMHVAAAAGVPTLAFFGPTTRELGFFPYGPAHRVLETPLGCRPCGLHGGRDCPEGHFLCMKLITVEQAFQAAKAMLASRREAAAA